MLAKLREELMVEKEKALDELSKSLKHKFEMMIEEERIKNEDKRREEVKRIEAEKQVRNIYVIFFSLVIPSQGRR